METSNLALAVDYYTQVGNKNPQGFSKYLHHDVEFFGPLANLKGKKEVVEATTNFTHAFHSLTIKAKFCTGDQAMVVYDVDLPGVSKAFPGAALLNFRDGLIVRIQLFYDGSRVMEKKEEIFSK